MLAGKATVKWDGAHMVARSDVEVMVMLRLVPLGLELALRRVLWLRDMVKWPAPHRHIICLVFGRADFEGEPTLTPEGYLNYDVAHLKFLARAVDADLRMVEEFTDDTVVEFFERWREAGRSYSALFRDDDVREAFDRSDPSAIRAV